MNLESFQTRDGNKLCYSQEQASRFAKEIAGDFNPLHDIGSRRFCVPGDLLFVTLLSMYGVATRTQVEFSNMVDDQMEFELPAEVDEEFELVDTRGKSCLTLTFSGERERNARLVSSILENYVKFSGKTFPDILVAQMQENNVMINPARPLVIYKSMQISLQDGAADALQASASKKLELQLASSDMAIEGKKATTNLNFELLIDGSKIGEGNKVMLLGGLRDYDCLLYTSPSPRDATLSRMPSSA